jgi:hypothetical protein
MIAEYILQMDLTVTDYLRNNIVFAIFFLQKLSNENRANYEHNVEDALAVLPKLKTGIDVNLKFNG